MLNDPQGREQLLALGTRNLPVLARGKEFVFAQNFGKLLEFVGLHESRALLPPAELVIRWTIIMRAAQRYLRQISDAAIQGRVIDNRDRSIRVLGHHVFRICEAFLDMVSKGIVFNNDDEAANRAPADGTCRTGTEIAIYGEEVIDQLQAWWNGLGEMSNRYCTQEIVTYYGAQSIHQLLERSTWHSAQHVRQLIAVFERLGIALDGALAAQDFAGRPMPEKLWE